MTAPGRLLISMLLGALAAGCQNPPAVERAPACTSAGCHKLAALTRQGSTAAPPEHTREHGQGLVRKFPLMAGDHKEFRLDYPRRGHHLATFAGQCQACHPVSAEGIRHGMSQYPAQARKVALSGGIDCAGSCHAWLKAQGVSRGFTPAKGAAPSYSGSLRPGDLLAASKDAHAKIFKQGYTKTAAAQIKLGRINPGCVGCHGIRNDKHGAMPGCLDCHKFGGVKGAVHKQHVAAIDKGRAALDPGHAKEFGCNYCHGMSGATKLKNAACYSCHLSGHQVSAPATGKPHFWKLPL